MAQERQAVPDVCLLFSRPFLSGAPDRGVVGWTTGSDERTAMSLCTSPRRATLVASSGLAAATLVALVMTSSAGAATTSSHPEAGTTTVKPLVAHTIINGAAHGWSSPDDLTRIGRDLYVSFQNGVASTGGTAPAPTQSTIVEFRLDGTIERTWELTGKCDGLTADPTHQRLIATVNEDGNSSLYTIPAGGGAPSHYAYDANPLPHGGGTDSITIYRGNIYVIASAPTTAGGPALYQVTLANHVAHLAAAPFYDSSAATIANTGQHNTPVNLAITDPDSSTVVPKESPRFAGDFMLDAQGDQQAIFANHLGTDGQHLQVLDLSQSVDDTAFVTSSDGALVTDDSNADSVVRITGTLTPGRAYASVTPGNANTPPVPAVANYLGSIDLQTGTVTAVITSSPTLEPHSLMFVPGAD